MKAVTDLVRRLDEVLAPRGFHRHKHTWNRRSPSLIDVIDVQLAKALDGVFANVGVLDPEIYAQAWLTAAPTFVYEPQCTVRSRLGFLMGSRDVCWSLGDPNVGDEIAAAVESFALPFLERLHEPLVLERHLESSPRIRQSYPPPIIYCALLKHRRGEVAEARRLLLELCSRTNEGWSERVECVMRNAGLDS
ncbi:MAG: DUF4304 domain-containing protein [Candidatus Bipolaricaulia bacterium]